MFLVIGTAPLEICKFQIECIELCCKLLEDYLAFVDDFDANPVAGDQGNLVSLPAGGGNASGTVAFGDLRWRHLWAGRVIAKVGKGDEGLFKGGVARRGCGWWGKKRCRRTEDKLLGVLLIPSARKPQYFIIFLDQDKCILRIVIAILSFQHFQACTPYALKSLPDRTGLNCPEEQIYRFSIDPYVSNDHSEFHYICLPTSRLNYLPYNHRMIRFLLIPCHISTPLWVSLENLHVFPSRVQ